MTFIMHVSDKLQIASVTETISKTIKDQYPKLDEGTGTVLCDAMLSHLLLEGFTDIQVSIGGYVHNYIELLASGDKAALEVPADLDENDRIEDEINIDIINKYLRNIAIQYRKDVNRFRIYPELKSDDINREIFEFYNNDERRSGPPLAILGYLISKHRLLFFLSVFNLSIKHLGALMLPVFSANIIDHVVNGHSFFSPVIYRNILAFFLALTLNLICFWIDALYYHRFVREIESGFKMALVQKLQLLSIKYHATAQAGRLLSKIISDVQFIQSLIYDHFRDMLHLTIDVIFVIITALIKFPPMLLFYLVIVPASILFIRSFANPILESRKYMRKQTENSNAAFKEMLEMASLTRAHGLAETEYRSISAKVNRVREAANQYDRLGVKVNNVTYGGFQGFRLVCLCFAAYLASEGYISIGTVVLFQSIFEMIVNSVQKVLDELPLITQGYDSVVSVNEILWEQDMEHNGSAELSSRFNGEIELRNVSFSYEEDQEPIIKNVSLTIPKGKSVAFIGKSGAGKSTLLNLILGLYSCTGGSILVDGVNIEELDKNQYRHHIAVVPQNTVLIAGTLWDNLVYGLKYVSKDRVIDVLKSVGLDDLLNSLPDGINSTLLENGGNLSGGQRQRLAIARALLRDSEIVILDEATSALDTESERQVQQAIDVIMKERTVIIVAHRLNTLKKVDHIYKIENGCASLCSSYEELLD